MAAVSSQAALTVSPSLVRMGTLKIGREKVFKVTVRGDRPFQIIAVDGQGDGVTAVLPAQPSQLHQLTLKCQPLNAGDLIKITAFVVVPGSLQLYQSICDRKIGGATPLSTYVEIAGLGDPRWLVSLEGEAIQEVSP